MNATEALLLALHEKHQLQHEKEGTLPVTDYVEEWEAPCYLKEHLESGEEQIAWKWVKQQPKTDFANVEKALELEIDSQLQNFFATVWAGDIDVSFRDRALTLLQVQGPEDMERLQQNLIGHVMMKQRLKQPITWFIGLTDEDDLLLTVSQETGVVGLEYVGKEQHEVLSSDLPTFLKELELIGHS
ncbi:MULTISPECIES: SecY-interacting protein [Gammaproteobacteria]|uniref:SecY-interacting protein n=1 Tax=Gammaproteobacteria TaxID=1236 RepID=UPI000DD03DAC|nr:MULTISPECIES: SecY-interacting protein [Gammaproteobacteria]RTE86983.1 SecY-interacting protein [Aliidiomarina sp. B3213]TCZ93227.1 SecY-interacting protein [Lysobacter sp. N42]